MAATIDTQGIDGLIDFIIDKRIEEKIDHPFPLILPPFLLF